MNYVVLTGPEGSEESFAGLFKYECDAFAAAQAAEDRGEFAVIYSLEIPLYCTSPA